MTQSLGIIDILISGEPPEYGLPRQADQCMASVPAGARIGEHFAGQRGQAKGIIKLAIGEQPRI